MSTIKKLNRLAVVAVIFALTTTVTLADGTTRTPYGGHNPVNTSIAGGFDLLIVAGILTYVVGTLFIVYGEKMKQLVKGS